MDRIRDLVSRVMARIGRICKCSGKQESVDKCQTTSAEKVAQVQQALQNGDVQHISELPVGKPTLRKTLHDMPAVTPHTTYQKERHWFDKGPQDTRGGGTPSNTFNRLEAFLSTTDPKQLLKLDPTWQQGLPEAPDDRPQPKMSSMDFPRVRRTTDEVPVEPLFDEGALSNSVSISGVF